MSYDVSYYSVDEQAAILILLNKVYGQPGGGITAYAPGNFATAALFNKRNDLIDALLSYLKDSLDDEILRAKVAETVLANRISAITGENGLGSVPGAVAALSNANWIFEQFAITQTGLQLNVLGGKAVVQGALIDFSAVSGSTSVTVTNGVPRNVVVYDNGAVSLEPTASSIPPDAVLIAVWNGTNLTTAPSLQKFANSIEFLNATKFGDNMHIGYDDRHVVYVHAAVADIDTRQRETTHNPDGTIATIAEKSSLGVLVKLTSFSYDLVGNIASTAVSVGGKTITTSYTYDTDGIMTDNTKTVL